MGFKLNEFRKVFFNHNSILLLLIITAVIVSVQNIQLGIKMFWEGEYTHYNNYVIFKQSFQHLIKNVNLYAAYPAEYGDFFKYSPSFALFMGLFEFLPDWAGLCIWNLLNVTVLYYAITTLNIPDTRKNVYILLFILPELILTTQCSQSNALIAGLILLSYNSLEKGHTTKATLFIVLSAFIKIYSLAGCLLLLLYPNRLRSGLKVAAWTTIIFILPVMTISFSDLIVQYKNWLALLGADHHTATGMSMMAFTEHLFPAGYIKELTQLLGIFIILSPLVWYKSFDEQESRIQFLSMLLLWMVTFNHMAESPTFIIVLVGTSVWYYYSVKTNYKTALAIMVFVFTSLWFTDLFPRSIKDYFFAPRYIKPFFPLVLLFTIYIDLIKRMITKNSDAPQLIVERG